MIRAVAIVVPARNESRLIIRCLSAIVAARDYALAAGGVPAESIRIVVVADACTDQTAELARSVEGVEVIEITAGAVGSARAAGALLGLDELCPPDASGFAADDVWLANTDADSVVPPNWITGQLALAARGANLILGTVRPDPADLSPEHANLWRENHLPGTAREHIYGANLGIRASHYRRAGGFAAVAEHEDVDLVARARQTGTETVATDAGEVITSGRRHGRTPGGFARYLRVDLVAHPIGLPAASGSVAT